MKLSEYLMAKALQHDDFELTKMAQDLYGTNEDIAILIKEAAIMPILGGLARAGSSLLRNNIIKNTAISTGVGAVAGAATAEKGNRLSGALKGGLVGGALGSGATVGAGVLKAKAGGMTIGAGFKQQFAGLKNTFGGLGRHYQKGSADMAKKMADAAAAAGQAPTAQQ